MKSRRYAILDVFTDKALSGNPLAVVLESDGLDSEAMQRIAGEFNLSETVFVSPQGLVDGKADIRIFTPAAEIQFAGHPTVGTAVLLATQAFGAGSGKTKVTLGEGVGPVHCAVDLPQEGAGSAQFTIPRSPEQLPFSLAVDQVASAIGLLGDDIGFDGHVPSAFTCGTPFNFVPVRSRDALKRSFATLNEDWLEGLCGAGITGVFVYCNEPDDEGSNFAARMFAPVHGIIEDPATGSAAAAFSGALMAYGDPADGLLVHVIEQGYDMCRPSKITLSIESQSGTYVSGSIGGQAVLVARGEIFV